jgi:predicted amidohydrolase YtcJ
MRKEGAVMSRFPIARSILALCGAGLLAAAVPAAAQKPSPADLVLTNGRIVTMDPAKPEVRALAVRGDRVEALGSVKEIAAYIGPATQVIDLGGRLATPGWIDAHMHFPGLGESQLSLDLTKARSWDDIVAMVAAAARKAKPGEPIIGRGWHQEKWDRKPEPSVDGLPTHTALSQAAPANPVVLTHASGHSSLANAKAMEMAGITEKTPNPRGGEIIKDAQGRPIGAFLETAQGLLNASLARWEASRTAEDKRAEQFKIIELADRECLSKGLTSVTDAGVGWSQVELYKRAIDQGKLGVRLNVMLSESNARMAKNAAAFRLIGYGADHLSVHAIKRLSDGALGAHGAWLLEPYTDLPTSTGLNTYPVADLRETARIAIENGYQLCVHAIGDRANRETLNVFEEAMKAHPDKKDVRFRVEHAQHLSAADIPRFGKLGVIAAMQAVHCTSDGPWVPKRIGDARAAEGAYVWRKLLDTGAVIANGTDAPVEDVDPIPVFYASVSRKMKNGGFFYPDQKMTREEALKSYTVNAAFAAFEEKIKGSLVPGKLADLTVFSKDILACPVDEIPSARAAMTIVGGKVLYKN